MIRANRNPDAGTHAHRSIVYRYRVAGQGFEDLLGYMHGVFRITDSIQNHRELIATQARDQITTANALAEELGNFDQELIAGIVT